MKDDEPGAEPFKPPGLSLRAMRLPVDECRGCRPCKDATQAVFGEGPAHAGRVLAAATSVAA